MRYTSWLVTTRRIKDDAVTSGKLAPGAGSGIATKVVAANDSSTDSKNRADYVCDGTADEVEINTAIDALPTTGGIVYLMEGTYNIAATITIDVDNTAIVGTGKSTKIVAFSPTAVPLTGNIRMIEATNLKGILIQNLHLYGGGGGATNNFGIRFNTVTDSSIINCWIENCGNEAIFLNSSSSFNKIVENVITLNANHGVDLSVTSNNNIIADNQISKQEGDGILLITSHNNIILGNQIHENDYDDSGIYDGILLATSDNNIIVGNMCKDNDRYEIDIINAGCDSNIVYGNVCNGTDHVGTIRDNGTNTQIFNNVE